MKLIKEWKQCLKFFSVQASLLGTVLSGTYTTMYNSLKDTIDPKTMAMITGAVFISSIIGRVLSQGIEND